MERPTSKHWVPLLKEAWPLGVGTIFGTALQQGPILVLSLYSLSAVGFYTAAMKVPLQLAVVPLVIRGSTFPLLSRSWIVDRGLFARQVDRLMAVSALMGVTIGLVGVGLAPEVVQFLFGAQFADAAPAFGWLMVMAAVLVPGVLLGEALIAAGFQRINLAILAGSLPVASALLFLLAHKGATGAAAAVTITYCALAVSVLMAAWLLLKPVAPLKWLVPVGASVAIGTGILMATSRFGALGALMAVGAALLLGSYLQRDSIAWLWRRISRTRLELRWSL
jgi:O-antigen/teichoic acid export membrane protein